jgi:hypothetical protein
VLDPHVVGEPLKPYLERVERFMIGKQLAYRADECVDVVLVVKDLIARVIPRRALTFLAKGISRSK